MPKENIKYSCMSIFSVLVLIAVVNSICCLIACVGNCICYAKSVKQGYNVGMGTSLVFIIGLIVYFFAAIQNMVLCCIDDIKNPKQFFSNYIPNMVFVVMFALFDGLLKFQHFTKFSFFFLAYFLIASISSCIACSAPVEMAKQKQVMLSQFQLERENVETGQELQELNSERNHTIDQPKFSVSVYVEKANIV